MKKRKENKLWVISLGGSRIVKEEGVDHKFLKRFERIIKRHSDVRFVVVTGGGTTARKYISALRKMEVGVKKQSKAGIAVTRMHAAFLARLFGKKANEPWPLPKNMKKVKNLLKANQVVFCGALRYKNKNTSDGTAADLAAYLKCGFINITNVRGLYTDNPKTNKKAKFIKKISWKDFWARAKKIKYEAGQHFILDQRAAHTIMKHKVVTYIVGSLLDFSKIIDGKTFKGTIISD